MYKVRHVLEAPLVAWYFTLQIVRHYIDCCSVVECSVAFLSPFVECIMDVLEQTVSQSRHLKHMAHTFGNVTLGTTTEFKALGAFLGAWLLSPLGWYWYLKCFVSSS